MSHAEMIPVASAATLREMRRGVAQAADAKLVQVVRTLDALADRGVADAVLAQVRHRLRGIRVERPLRFPRLLFLPLDPLIVTPKVWRPRLPSVPRTALAVLSSQVNEKLRVSDPSCLEAIEALISGATTSQLRKVNEAGGLLWPKAAVLLHDMATDCLSGAASSNRIRADWLTEGLPAGSLAPLARGVSVILANAVRLNDWEQAGVVTIGHAELTEMLTSAERADPLAWGMMMALLATRFPQTPQIFQAASAAERHLRPLADAAIERALAWAEAETTDREPPVVGSDFEDVAQKTALLDALGAHGSDPLLKRRALDARANLLTGCLRRTDAMLREYMTLPLQSLPDNQGPRGAALDAMENVARTVRQFETSARRLGTPHAFDALIQRACDSITEAPDLSRMDKARLIEVLAGPDAAIRVLMGG